MQAIQAEKKELHDALHKVEAFETMRWNGELSKITENTDYKQLTNAYKIVTDTLRTIDNPGIAGKIEPIDKYSSSLLQEPTFKNALNTVQRNAANLIEKFDSLETRVEQTHSKDAESSKEFVSKIHEKREEVKSIQIQIDEITSRLEEKNSDKITSSLRSL